MGTGGGTASTGREDGRQPSVCCEMATSTTRDARTMTAGVAANEIRAGMVAASGAKKEGCAGC